MHLQQQLLLWFIVPDSVLLHASLISVNTAAIGLIRYYLFPATPISLSPVSILKVHARLSHKKILPRTFIP